MKKVKVENGRWKDARQSNFPLSVFRFLLLATLTLPVFSPARAQIAGMDALTLLDQSSTARTAGLGMDYLALYGNDLTVAIDNPSMLRSEMAGQGVMNFATLFGTGSFGSLAYAHNFERVGTLLMGFHFNNYGSFEGYDEEETYTGSFSAADYALYVSYAMWLDSNFSVGVTFKPVLSQYESYTALAAAFDVAASYSDDSRKFTATLIARNIGAQLMTFDETVETLPFELSAALSYKLAKAPFRLFFALTELQQWNLRYEDPLNPTTETDPFTGEVSTESWFEGTFDNLMRHTLFGVELNIGKALYARLGYSYRQTAEVQGADAFNLSGFSFGIGLHTRRFDFSYARRNYHFSQAPNFLTLTYRF